MLLSRACRVHRVRILLVKGILSSFYRWKHWVIKTRIIQVLFPYSCFRLQWVKVLLGCFQKHRNCWLDVRNSEGFWWYCWRHWFEYSLPSHTTVIKPVVLKRSRNNLNLYQTYNKQFEWMARAVFVPWILWMNGSDIVVSNNCTLRSKPQLKTTPLHHMHVH